MNLAAPGAATGTAPGDGRRREQRGWYFYDWANSAFATTVGAVFLGPYLTDVAHAAADTHGFVHPFGIAVRDKALFPLVLSVSVVVQVAALPLAGALADHTGRKRRLLGVFAYVGAAATTGLYFVAGGRYLLGAALFVVANVALGASTVVYNSFLPDIAAPDERDAVSARGWGIGYLGGGLLLALDLALFLLHDRLGLGKAAAVRISLASAGMWWAVFTVIPLRALRDHRPPAPLPGPSHRHADDSPRAAPAAAGSLAPADAADPAGTAAGGGTRGGDPRTAAGARPGPGRGTPVLGALAGGFRTLGGTLRDVRRRPMTLLFLLAFLIYNDGVQTVIAMAATFATQELRLGQTVVIAAVLLVQFVAFGGALLLGRLAGRYGARRVVLAALVTWTFVVLASYALRRGSVPQFLALATAIGVVMGGTQALSRSLFSHLVPREREAEYFGFYEISDKGTSWLGPFVFAVALQWTDSYRDAIAALVIFFVAGFALLLAVDLPRGAREAGNDPPRLL